jgi:hypothetical protein
METSSSIKETDMITVTVCCSMVTFIERWHVRSSAKYQIKKVPSVPHMKEGKLSQVSTFSEPSSSALAGGGKSGDAARLSARRDDKATVKMGLCVLCCKILKECMHVYVFV